MNNPNTVTQILPVSEFETGLEQHNVAPDSEDYDPVMVLEIGDPCDSGLEIGDWTEEEWMLHFSQNGLNNLSGAYGDNEPDY